MSENKYPIYYGEIVCAEPSVYGKEERLFIWSDNWEGECYIPQKELTYEYVKEICQTLDAEIKQFITDKVRELYGAVVWEKKE